MTRPAQLVFAILAATVFFVIYGTVADYLHQAATTVTTQLEQKP